MSGAVTLIKYMTQKEFLDFITSVHTFKCKLKDGSTAYSARLGKNKNYYKYNVLLSSLDYEDVLIRGEGYVRYSRNVRNSTEEDRFKWLIEEFGFKIEH